MHALLPLLDVRQPAPYSAGNSAVKAVPGWKVFLHLAGSELLLKTVADWHADVRLAAVCLQYPQCAWHPYKGAGGLMH